MNEGKTFWQVILDRNFQRKREGKVWAFPTMIEHALYESGFTDPNTLMDFIDAEWERLKPEVYNIQAKK